jgi:phosphoglycolate phosphatase-like HAD superfamily hydrolase
MSFDPGRVRAVLFDVDGTLADTDDEYIRRAGQFIRRLHFLFPQRDPTNFLRWSLMVAETPANLLMGLPDWLGVDDELARFFAWVSGQRAAPPSDGHFVLMAGVQAMLTRLAERYPLGVVTVRSAGKTQGFLDQFGLAGCFRVVATAQSAPRTKPFPDPILWCARQLEVPVESCLMVGDTTVDILAGKRAGAQTAGVLCGFGDRAELERAGATLILERTADVAQTLLGPAAS